MIARFDGKAAWGRLAAEQQAEVGAIALELVAAWHLQEADHGDERLDRLATYGDAELIGLLEAAFVAAVDRSELTDDAGRPRVPSLLGPICRVCGCTDNAACEGGCAWAEEDLCTACAAPARGMATGGRL